MGDGILARFHSRSISGGTAVFRRYLTAFLFIALTCAVGQAADLDQNGLDDKSDLPSAVVPTDVGDIAVVDTGSSSVSAVVNRLLDLGYPVTTIPVSSGLDVLVIYSLVILPVSHGDAQNYSTFEGLASDYHMYVNTGGGLWVGQPNPYGMPGNQATITWVPYALTLHNGYQSEDCPPVIVDSDHCITTGLAGTQFSFPGDEVLDMGSEWHVVVEGGSTGRPGVMVAEYGSGKILVELGHPSNAAGCPIDDAALERYVECTIAGVVAVERTTWSEIKAQFR